MARFKVVVTDQVFPDVDTERELLAAIDAELEVADGTLEDALARGKDADALLNTYLPIDRDTIAGLDRCRIVARYGIGVDNVDLDAASEAGIVVTNVPDYCVEEVAVQTVAMLLSLVRRLPRADALVRSGGWNVGPLRPIRRFSEMTVGLIGLGRIARHVAAPLLALGAEVQAHDPYVASPPEGVRLVDLDTLLRTSDAVCVHAPLTPETRGMIGPEQLAAMRDDAILVNTSRGPLVQLDPLLEALADGRLGGAALDVFEVEPPDAARLKDVPNLLTSPHTAYYSEQSLRESQRKAATQIVKVLTGETPDYAVTT